MRFQSGLRINPGSALLALGVALLPVYIFPSGGVQPAHLVLALFSGIVIFRNGLPSIAAILLLGVTFVYVLFIESIYSIGGAEVRHLIHPVFFLYNFVIVSATFTHIGRNGLGPIKLGIVVAACAALASVLIGGVDLHSIGEEGRETGSFNNPNQLGYFSVCLLSIAYVLYKTEAASAVLSLLLFLVAVGLSIASLSKAAMISNFLVALLVFMPRISIRTIPIWAGIISVSVLLLIFAISRGMLDDFIFFQRIANMANENDSSLEARGYFAFLEANGAQLVFGLGTQGVHDIFGNEVHSTLGNMLNAYGVIGFLIMFSVMLVWATNIWRAYGLIAVFCICGPAMLYGLTHNGTRFSIFWLLFACSLAVTREQLKKMESEAASSVAGFDHSKQTVIN